MSQSLTIAEDDCLSDASAKEEIEIVHSANFLLFVSVKSLRLPAISTDAVPSLSLFHYSNVSCLRCI
ncbi:hypothetical protein V3C99_018436 [Haemonchus contortus]|uniref:Uncharacterized protein n=1 Tax=Haemonchus contortus TaxID=6289 RepID=A0A7I4Z2F3_HAECO